MLAIVMALQAAGLFWAYKWAIKTQKAWEDHLFLYWAWKQHFQDDVACSWIFHDGMGDR